MSYALMYQQPDGSSPHRRVGIFGVALPLPPPLILGPSPLFPGRAAQCGHVESGFGAQKVFTFFLFFGGWRQSWNGLPRPSPKDLPDPGIKPRSPVLAGRLFTTSALGSPGLEYEEWLWESAAASRQGRGCSCRPWGPVGGS